MEIIRRRELRILTGLSSSTLYRKEKSGDFPGRIRLGRNSVGWPREEVEVWLSQQPRGMADVPVKAIAARAAKAQLKDSASR